MLWWSPPLVFGKTDGEWLRRPGLDLVGVVPTFFLLTHLLAFVGFVI
jgi:hypothetical protein